MLKLKSPQKLISDSIKENYGICPFCGENNNSLSLNEYRSLYWIYCKNCHADGPSKTSIVEAIEAWQTLNINKE